MKSENHSSLSKLPSIHSNPSIDSFMQGIESIYRPYDQFHLPRRTGISMSQLSRFKVWISVLKFNLSPKSPDSIDDMHENDMHGPHANDITNEDVIVTTTAKSRGYHNTREECNGMLRIWDGPLREVPTCSDLNWY